MRIDLSRLDALMSEQFLHGADVCAGFQKVRRPRKRLRLTRSFGADAIRSSAGTAFAGKCDQNHS
jgi:hypothetical protein